MRYISATEANQNLSRILREVAEGASYTITSRGKPVAEIRAPTDNGTSRKRQQFEDMLERMKLLPGAITGPYTRDDIYDRNQ
jgi:antitoxin (DNA-binding transcriptional repressor) of toxin-antitoxin stability system